MLAASLAATTVEGTKLGRTQSGCMLSSPGRCGPELEAAEPDLARPLLR
jgi:hypothetical protein